MRGRWAQVEGAWVWLWISGRRDSRGVPWRRCRPPPWRRRQRGTARPRRRGGRAAPGEGAPRLRPAALAGPACSAPVLCCDKAPAQAPMDTGWGRGRMGVLGAARTESWPCAGTGRKPGTSAEYRWGRSGSAHEAAGRRGCGRRRLDWGAGGMEGPG